MQKHQRRVIGRVLDEIQSYRDGRQSMLQLLNRCWGLFEAAELRDPDDRDQFLDVYRALSGADDANQPWTPAGLGSDKDVETALVRFEEYARAFRDQGSDGDVAPGVIGGY
jgi:hypothetical protein